MPKPGYPFVVTNSYPNILHLSWISTHRHTSTETHMLTCMHTNAHTLTYTHASTRVHAHTRAHTHTHTHMWRTHQRRLSHPQWVRIPCHTRSDSRQGSWNSCHSHRYQGQGCTHPHLVTIGGKISDMCEKEKATSWGTQKKRRAAAWKQGHQERTVFCQQ